MKNVYIVLSRTGTWPARVIRYFTKDIYSHSSISFDKSLETMYSFGRKTPFNMFDGGFIEENFNKGVFRRFNNSKCKVLEVPVTDTEYCSMWNEVQTFKENEHIYRYNIWGLTSFMTGVPVRQKNSYFCSQFVSWVLHKTNWWNLCDDFVKPVDFLKIPLACVIYEGDVKAYPYGGQREALSEYQDIATVS